MPAPALPEPSVRQLAQLVEQVSGNVVPESFFPFLAEVAQERRVARGFANLSDYVKALASGRLSEEWRQLLAAITIKESSFFRTPQHFEALKDQIIPLLVQTRHASRTLRLWSAGCARGEEPATLAMVLAEHPLLSGWSWSILATDVDEEALEAARRGFYSEKAVAALPAELKERYFTPQAGGWLLSPRLLQRITYRYLNLIAEPFPSFPQPFDIIMLRNVLIYFRLASQKRVLANIATALAPDGFLFLGPAETVWQVSDRFELVDLGTCFVYRPQVAGRSTPTRPRPAPPGKPQKPAAPERKAPPPQPKREAQPAAPKPETEPLAEAVAFLTQGRLGEAQEALRQLLAANPADAQAHALEGYIHEVAGRPAEAIAAFRACLYLEPDLFQARLLLAHALRRAGETTRAQAEYRHLLSTLAAGGGRELDRLAALPLPTREQAARQAQAALEGLQSP
uniref:Tetratricopeptide repeat protein n=2 Tax=Thermoanaerobaculum aquaticum TaxID=1312852 RepID=A0A7V2EF38_9BACT